MQVKQNEKARNVTTGKDEKGAFIIYQAAPNSGLIEVSETNQ